jgi:cell volume regulation protein A
VTQINEFSEAAVVETSQILAAQHFLLICVLVLGVGAALQYVAQRTGIPDIALFLLAGIGLGPAGADLIDISVGSTANQLVLLFGASYILFDGGAAMRLAVLKRVWITVVVLATIGVIITALITGAAAYLLFALPVPVALLLGSVIASTDPATLIPVFRQVKVREHVKQTVIAESACNDAVGAILTFALLAVAVGRDVSLTEVAKDFVWQAGLGIVVGGVAGYLACVAIAHDRLGFLREHLTLVTLIVVIGSLLAADNYEASGFMAVFVAGLVLGNKDGLGFALSHAEERRMEDFINSTGLIMRMFIFILLGAQVDLQLMETHALPAVGVVAVLMLVARPLVVLVCAAPDRRAHWNLRELLFICWTRETGVIPAALAGMLVGVGTPGADIITTVTFTAVLMTIMLQATSTRWLARRLGLLES